jgi:hypothetical protein
VATDVRDPRSIVTPAAFQIDPSLLGLPLATPRQRLIALGIDFALVGLLTALLSSVQLIIWGAIAIALVRVAFKRSGRSKPQAAALLMRTSAGCLGVFILFVALGVWATGRMGEDEREAALESVIERGAELAPELRREIGDMNYDGADTPEDALRVMRGGARRMRDVPLAVRRQLLRASVPPDATWAAQKDSLVELALVEGENGAGAGEAPDSAIAAVAALSDAEALRALAAATDSSTDDARVDALRSRAAQIVAADTLAALANEVEDLQSDVDNARQARADLEREAEESRSGAAAFVALLGDVWQEIGSALGLWTFYFTLLLTLWRGQTVGKRFMRVRVLRLDGQPIGWWSAFERAGGYAAGVATGFLGFAQIFWDSNRQCIHDKISETVVVVDGAERAPWEAEWARRTKS